MSKNRYIIPIFIPHEGCPNDCSFCNQKTIAGTSSQVNVEKIETIIQSYLKLYTNQQKQREIAFYGGSFTGLPMEVQKQYLTVAFNYKKKGLIDGIRLSTRPDYINEEILQQLKFYGVTIIELGVQSTNEEVLKMNKRGHSKDDVFKAVKSIRKYEFQLGLQMMIGLFGDTEQRIEQTAKDLISLRPDFVRIYPTLVIRDTALERYYYEGIFEPLGLEECVDICESLLVAFEGNHIKVIRLGLQSTEEIAYGKSIIAGPYHPALRELVESKMFSSRIEALLHTKESDEIKGCILTVYCHPRSASKVAGHKKCNKSYFLEKYQLAKFIVKTQENIDEKEVEIQITKVLK
ncbi:Radical SAM domain protein [Alkaliphilus metalliredigens QYMF]|uniref:Radical SAM domain protein n=1 Tax=Alkaliphilus metalliredigens (strain QYMF) TaxID=293826 RepID=A6TRT4_ALKMQ|nr:radical SAM protein [Alkaliphilus metalliredigens]ABR48902.1 Radical SAM domain protein [Alkaliphilus metalliredigens QYMF]